MHGGEPIVRGVRYILAVFAYISGGEPSPQDLSIDDSLQTREENDHEICDHKKPRIFSNSWTSLVTNNIDSKEQKSENTGMFSFNFTN
jgi:hypothetical protein